MKRAFSRRDFRVALSPCSRSFTIEPWPEFAYLTERLPQAPEVAATGRTAAVAIACPCCSAGRGNVARRRAGAFRVYINGMMPGCMREIRETMYLSG